MADYVQRLQSAGERLYLCRRQPRAAQTDVQDWTNRRDRPGTCLRGHRGGRWIPVRGVRRGRGIIDRAHREPARSRRPH